MLLTAGPLIALYKLLKYGEDPKERDCKVISFIYFQLKSDKQI